MFNLCAHRRDSHSQGIKSNCGVVLHGKELFVGVESQHQGLQMEDSLFIGICLTKLTKLQCFRPIKMDKSLFLQPSTGPLNSSYSPVIVIFGSFHHSTPLGSADVNARPQTPVNGSSASPPDRCGCGMDHRSAFTKTRMVKQSDVPVTLTGKWGPGKRLCRKPGQHQRSLTATAEIKALMRL